MTRSSLTTVLVTAALVGLAGLAPARAQDRSDLSGKWTLNRELSQFPREIGFAADWASAAARGADSTAGGGRRSGASEAGAFSVRPESEEEARRKQQLTTEVRTPPARLAIVETPTAVTISDDTGQSRTFHPDGRDETLQLDEAEVVVNAKREAGRLIVLYKAQQGRELRYTYSRTQSPPQLVVEVQFVERGGGDHVRRVYEPAAATETQTPASAAPSATTTRPTARTAGSPEPAVPALADRPPAETFDQRPDAPLRGLTRLAVVVEDLGPQAVACGLSQTAIEAMVAKRLSEGGFTVVRNADEDTYIYVNVNTGNVSTGFCVSRYDVYLYTHTTAKLPYHGTPVLVEVSLLHKGGIGGNPAAAHGAAVLRDLQEYVDTFISRIHDANK